MTKRGRPTNKAMLSAFGDRYDTIEHNGGYLLYDKERPSNIANAHYIGKFYISSDGKRYAFNDDYYSDVDSMLKAMDDYNQKLPFDIEIYNPIFRKNYHIEVALSNYIRGLGFKHEWGDGCYVLTDMYGQKLCVIQFEIKPDTTTGSVSRLIPNSDRWIEAPFTDLDSAVGACNGLIAAYCASINASTMNVLNSLTTARCSLLLDKTFDIKSLTVYTDDAKRKTIEFLEEELKRLKQ